MLGKIKRIFTHGAIYGVAQLGGKILNFLLIPFFTFIMQKSEMGVYTDLYTWVAFLIIVLTFGSETAFFKFAQEIDSDDPEKEFKEMYNNRTKKYKTMCNMEIDGDNKTPDQIKNEILKKLKEQ